MLIFNDNCFLLSKIPANLNTSHVNLQHKLELKKQALDEHLNISHVNLQPAQRRFHPPPKADLNTSHVNLQRRHIAPPK